MTPHYQPLNPVQRKALQHWLGEAPANTLRKILRAKIVHAECQVIRQAVNAVGDPQYTKDAMEAAGEVVFYERVLDLLGTIQAGHKPDKPTEEFEYEELTSITDQEPLTTQPHA